jgi:ribonuclease J
VAITTFSSNVGRIRSIAEAARDAGREVLLLGRSIKRVVNVATELGMMEGIPEFLAEDEYGYIPRDKVVVILTGSQGEPRAALAKLSRDEMRNVALTAGDTVVFSSRTIPGNEKGILEIKNGLIDRASRSSPTAMRWCMSPATRAATNWCRCTSGSSHGSWCRCMARPRI